MTWKIPKDYYMVFYLYSLLLDALSTIHCDFKISTLHVIKSISVFLVWAWKELEVSSHQQAKNMKLF